MMHFKKLCCDPLNLKKCTKQLIAIRPSILSKLVTLNVEGNNICSSCNVKISKLKASQPTESSSVVKKDCEFDFSSVCTDASESESDQELDTEPAEYEKLELINSLNRDILPALKLTPIKTQKISSAKYTIQKLLDLTSSLKRMFGSQLNSPTSNELGHQKTKAEQFDEFINKLKIKFAESNTKDEKYQILTLLPTEWSARKIENEFGCSSHMAKSSKKLQEEKGVLSIPNPKLPSNVLASGTKEMVEYFYLEDDISRMMPGKNDCVSIVVNGKKQKVQKRMMLSTLNQSYHEFKNQNETIKISVSHFIKYRPKECVYLGSRGTHLICVCTIHQNVKQMLFSGKVNKRTNGAIMHYEHCIAKVTCNPPQQQCFMRTCENCPKIKNFKKYLINAMKGSHNGTETAKDDCESDIFEIEDVNEMQEMIGDLIEDDIEVCSGDESEDDECDQSDEENSESEANDDEGSNQEEEIIHFRQWVSTDRCEFKHFVKPVSEFVNDFADKLEKLVTHSFVATEQTKFLKNLKENLKIGEFIICGDFSENFSFVLQNEAQGYYWARKQATIHPFVIYYKNEKNELQHLNYVIISECLKHDSVAVYLFITKLIKFLESKFQLITKLFYFTDGCAGQYKNLKNFVNVYFHKIDFGYDCEWHFHATSHGKGPCDGLGGTLKRSATRASLARAYEKQIDTPQLLFEWASTSKIDMNFGYTATTEHDNMASQLRDRFDAAKQIKGTLKYHCFIPKENGQLLVKFYSNETGHKMVTILKFENCI